MRKSGILEISQQYAVVAALAIWMGGLSFYGLVVVPTGAKLLGSTQQGFVTRQVTSSLNLIGCAALAILLWDAIRQRRKLLGTTWIVMLATQIALMVLHTQLDKMLNPADQEVLDESRFHALHEVYLTITACQWTTALIHLALTLWSWRTDRLP